MAKRKTIKEDRFTNDELKNMVKMCTYVLNTCTKNKEKAFGLKLSYISSIGQKAINKLEKRARKENQ